MGTSLLGEYHQQQSAQSPDSSSLLDEYRAQQKPDTSGSLLDEYRARQAKPSLASQYEQFARQRFQQLKADPLAPFKGLAQNVVQPVIQQGKDALTIAGDYRGGTPYMPIFANPPQDVGALGRTALNLVTPGALRTVGEAAAPLVRSITGAGAEAEAPAAAAFEQNPTLPEALAPTVNETPKPSAAAANVRRSLSRRAPVATPQPAEPVQGFMNWAQAAEDPETSPMLREYAAQRANAARPAAQAVFAEQAATPFPGEPGAPPVPPEAPEEPRPEGFAFSEPLGSEARASEPTADELQYRFGGPGVLPQQAEKIADIQRSALTSPFSRTTREYPRVAEKANQVGAARNYANWLATRGVQYANEGLTPEQVGQFYNRLVVDNLEAVNPGSPALAFHRAQYPAGVENEPWFKAALDNYQTNIESRIEPYAAHSGVGEAQMRRPSLGAYVKLLAVDPETGAPFTGPGGSVPKNLSPRVLKTVSAQQATGTAARYSADPQAIVASQGEKIVKGARNQLIDVARETGRPLEGKELPMPGEGVIVREHSRPVQTADGETVPVLTRQRYAVPQSVADAVAHAQKQLATGATTPWAQAKIPRLMTGASLEFSPAAAPYHMASLTAKAGKVPGVGVLDELPNALPILGQRAQGIARVVGGVDFSDPADRAMEARLAKIGALRPSDAERKTILSRVPGVGQITQGLHDLLFGPQGVDVRTRIWLGKRFVAENPGATDDQIRKFVTDLAGNYVRENSGDLVNGLQDLGATAYARFAVPSIKTGITQNIGISGLGNRPGLVARQLVRGAAGTLAGIELLNRALSGHGPESNNAGHRFDIDVTPEANAFRRAIGKSNSAVPIYAKISALDPGFSRAARATGVDAIANHGDLADAATQAFNTNVLGLLSPAARFGYTLGTGYQPYFGRSGPIAANRPVAPGGNRFMARLSGAASGAAGSLEAAFGGGSPNARPFGGVSTVMNLALPQLFTSGSGLSPEEAAARDRYFQMKDYRAAQRRNARQRAAQ